MYAVGCAAKVVQVARGTATGHPDAFHFSVLVQVRGCFGVFMCGFVGLLCVKWMDGWMNG